VELDTEKIDQAVLALLALGRHDGYRTCKAFDWESMGRLHEKGYITRSRRQSEVGAVHRGRRAAAPLRRRDEDKTQKLPDGGGSRAAGASNGFPGVPGSSAPADRRPGGLLFLNPLSQACVACLSVVANLVGRISLPFVH
jgi:hypothetical protein